MNADAHTHEELLVRSFIIAAKRPRLQYLFANPKRRPKGLQILAHYNGLDPRCTREIPRPQHASVTAATLRALGAPEECYLISEDSSLDGAFMPLQDALQALIDSMSGGFVSCVPGVLAYFQTEEPGERFILERRAAQILH